MGRSVRLMFAAVGIWLALTPVALGAQERVSDWQPASPTAPRVNLYPSHQLHFDGSPLAEERAALRAAAGRTHWREGALIGGVAFAVAGGYVGGGICGANDEASCTEEIIGGGLVGAAAGVLIGGLVGSLIH
jgi:hypothetical protein